MYEILLWELKLVSTNFVFAIKIKLYKSYQKWFSFIKKVPFILEIFNFLYFPLPLFFLLLTIADFIEEVDWW